MSTAPVIITIDGPAGVGKTTLAKGLARRLQIAYLDTGAMYRAAAWMLGPSGAEMQEDELASRLASMRFTLKGAGPESCLLLEDRVIGDQVRTEEVGLLASSIAALGLVREYMKKSQQKIGREISLVAEGRDMGTVVFPGAPYKFFLQADPVIRAARRCRQLQELGQDADEKRILEQMRRRDSQDSQRAIAPLVPASDAVSIDTGSLTPEEILDRMEAIFADKEVRSQRSET
ncbi:(d)CMP kinase [Desulfonatronospira sp.]|uniref:(d)CMP kinase n=1 Tax=Desulfonatronospira sp. TaxID=1962951 RepID=UPI0025C333CD|nr:(d)CMP kinase [Desulfonatronospira sp.]